MRLLPNLEGFSWNLIFERSRDSSVGIATRYGLEGPEIESLWGEIFRTHPDRLRGPPSPLYNGYRVFPGGKGGRGVMLTTHPLLVPRLRTSWAIPPLTLWVLLGLLWGSLYIYLWFLRFFPRFSREFKFHYNLTGIKDTLHDDRCTFMIISRWILLRMRNVPEKIVEKIKTHILYSTTFPRKSCRL
jgi:hypothetical protein